MLTSVKHQAGSCQASRRAVSQPACSRSLDSRTRLRLSLHTRATPTKDSPTQASSPSSSGSSTPGSSSVSDLLDREFTKGLIEELGDQSQLGKRGEAWTIAQFVALALVVVPPFHSTALTSLVGVLLLLGGGAAIASGLQKLGTSLTPLPMPRKGSQLVTTGAYQYMRHPMYGGLLMASLGLAAVTHDESRLLAAGVLWLVLEQKVAFEEKLLVERYGVAYQDYQQTVKKFLPYLY